jgi:hypothetical protein
MTTDTTTRWSVELSFDEDPNHTVALARLEISDGREFTGVGHARRNPSDRPAATIGEVVAASRAMSHLAHELLDFAAGEIQNNVRRGAPA